ncbi:hypothetical protein [Streptomyces sp. NPDC001292]|uniref:hypothetical protein n=1 Tax=Streptomyces sp. NPDC001292 TaxID=3364558 RepID=UPI00368BD561
MTTVARGLRQVDVLGWWPGHSDRLSRVRTMLDRPGRDARLGPGLAPDTLRHDGRGGTAGDRPGNIALSDRAPAPSNAVPATATVRDLRAAVPAHRSSTPLIAFSTGPHGQPRRARHHERHRVHGTG